jgi:DNA replication protein DnaC
MCSCTLLDDWGPERLSPSQRRDLMEIIEERHGRSSTLITSQLPVEAWHEVIGEPTFADVDHEPYYPHNAAESMTVAPSTASSDTVERS